MSANQNDWTSRGQSGSDLDSLAGRDVPLRNDNLDDETARERDETRGSKPGGDTITTGSFTNAQAIAIGRGASVNISYYPIRLRAPLRKVFAPLIDDRTELFGGREDELVRLAQFIQDPAGGYLVITAPAGFGKTALVAIMVSRTPEAFAYHFFTPLYGSDSLSEPFFLKNVVEQLAQWHGYTNILPESLDELRALYQQFLDEPLERTQVLVLDGLDEVTTWKLTPYLSRRVQPRLHIILTVRDVGQDWADDYSLPAGQTTHLPLGGLTREDVQQVLREAGQQAIVLADDAALLDEVLRVAAYEGDVTLGADPFYIRLLAEDAAEGHLTPANVKQQPSGLHRYLDAWWQDIKQMAGEATARDLFGTLTVALGPISRADLEGINPSLVDAWAQDYFDEVLRKVRRMVVGDEQAGYALVHPRLREYMHTQIKTAPYCDKMLTYCSNWQAHRSPYVLAHYAQHLFEAGDKEALYNLISKTWMDAQFEQVYSHRAFSADVELAIAAAEQEGPPNVVQIVRNSFVYATLGSLATNVPPEALKVLVEVGRREKAEGYAALIQDPLRQSEAFCQIGMALVRQKQVHEAQAVIERAISVAERIEERGSRALALSQVVKALTAVGDGTQAVEIADKAVALALSVPQRGDSNALVSTTIDLSQAGQVDRGVSVLKAIGSSADRSLAWIEVLKNLVKDGNVEQAMILSETIDGQQCRTLAWVGLVEALVQAGEHDRAVEIANRAVVTAEATDDQWYNPPLFAQTVRALTQVGEYNRAVEVANRAVVAAEAIKDKGERAWACAGVARGLAQARQASRALTLAESIEDQKAEDSMLRIQLRAKGWAFVEIAKAFARTGDYERALVLVDKAEALAQIRSANGAYLMDYAFPDIEYIKERYSFGTSTRVEVIRILAESDQVERALAATNAFNSQQAKDQALNEIVEVLAQSGQAEQALAIVKTISNARARAWALAMVATKLANEGKRELAAAIADQAVAEVEVVSDPWTGSWAIGEMVKVLAQAGQMDQAMALVEIISNVRARAKALVAVVQSLAQRGQGQQAAATADRAMAGAAQVVATEDTGWPDIRANTMVEVVNALSDVGQDQRALEIIEQVVVVAESSKDSQTRESTLAQAISSLAQLGKVDRALKLAEAIDNPYWGAPALAEVVKSLSRAGESEQATVIADRAVAFAQSLGDSWAKGPVMAEVVIALIEAGQIDRALAAVKDINNLSDKVSGLAEAVRVLGQMGEDSRAEEVADHAVTEAEKNQDWSVMTTDLTKVIRALAHVGKGERVTTVADRTIAAAAKVDELRSRAQSQAEVASTLAQIGKIDWALETAESITYPTVKVSALEAVAEALIQAGQKNRAMEIAHQIELATETIDDLSESGSTLVTSAKILTKLGENEQALTSLRKALSLARIAGRSSLFNMLSIPLLYSIDRGQTLWRIHEALLEVDRWWSTNP